MLALIFCLTKNSQAQTNGTIDGSLIDTVEHKDLTNALVSLINPQDSTLIHFMRTESNGKFQFTGLDTGHYIIMISHPYFADIFEKAAIINNTPVHLGSLNLFSRIQMMKEVIIKTDAPIRVKGDTVIYTADSFKVQEGANVEELLRKLPGITVDRDGKITAMGQSVKNVLVDGEEFFGSDPGIATKNLRADIVKDVEVYDKKSDQAAFTGIDDGVKEKTINLKLKEDKKKGYFGKIEAGGGLKGNSEGDQNKFNNAVMLNAFKAKRKIAGYGIMSNTGTLNLSWDDSQKYGEGNNMQVGDGGIMFFSGGRDMNSASGIPTSWSAGLHYSNKFDEDKHGINIGYKYNKINDPAFRTENSRYFYPDSSYNTTSRVGSYNTTIRNNLNLTYDFKLDSMNSLKVIARGNTNSTRSSFTLFKDMFSGDFQDTLSRQFAKSQSEQDNQNAYTSVLWLHKFKKPFRTLSISADYNYINSKNIQTIYNHIDFYKNNMIDSTTNPDQQYLMYNKTNAFNSKIAYTEPLAKEFYMELSYALNSNRNTNDRSAFNNDGSGNYTDQVDSLSNDYAFNSFSNSPGVNFRLNKKKYSFSFGTVVGFTNYTQLNETLNESTQYHYTNHYPKASFTWKIKQSENLSFYYYGAATAPSLRQLQPILDLSDPLNRYTGNPELRPSFNHSFNLNYFSFKMLKERNLFANMGYNFTQNAFVTSNWMKNAVTYSQTKNANGVANFYTYINYGFKLKKANMRIDFGPNLNWSRNVNFTGFGDSLSVEENNTSNMRYGFSVGLFKSKDDKYQFSMRPGINYTSAHSSLNAASDFKYWSGSINASANINITKTIIFNTDYFGNFQQKYSDFGSSANFSRWNAYVSKKFYKNQFEARFSVFDILNQNKGYNLNSSTYAFTETYRTILKRLWLVSFIWNINSTGAKPANAK